MVWVLQVYSVACLERPSCESVGLEIVKQHTKSTAQDTAKHVFGHVSQVVPNKLEEPANQEGLGLVCVQIRNYKRKRCVSCPQKEGPPSPLKERGRGTQDNSLIRTRRKKKPRIQAKQCKRNRKPRERDPVLHKENKIQLKRDGFQTRLRRRLYKSKLHLSEVSPTQTSFEKSLFVEVPSLFTVAESQYPWTSSHLRMGKIT